MTTAKMRKAIDTANAVIADRPDEIKFVSIENLAEMFLQLTTAVSIMKSAYDAQLEKKGRKK